MYYDLVIVGGGMVGAGLAVALRSTDLRIALIDARIPTGQDERLFALNHGSCHFLANLGLWPHLVQHAAPIHQVHVSRQKHFGAVRLKREEVNLRELGNVIPARYIEAQLHEQLLTLPNVTLFRPAKLKRLEQDEAQVYLQLETERGMCEVQAGLVIGADGTDSTVRAELGLNTETFDYQQSAIVTRTCLQRAHQQIAYERFTADGAIAMLPLVGNESATIWTADNRKVEVLMALSNAEFLKKLQEEFGYRLGRFQQTADRFVYPLRMVKAEKAVVGHVLLLGNAAHTFHPIAAQGFNLALYEVAAVAEALAAQKKLTTSELELLSARTQKQQAVSMGVSHQLAQVFSDDSRLLSALAQWGMIGLDILTPVKKQFIQRILGRAGQTPNLLLSANEHEKTI